MTHTFINNLTKVSLIILLGFLLLGIELEAQTCQGFSVSLSSTSHTLDAQNTIVICSGDSITFQAQTDYPNNNQGYTQSDASTEFFWWDNDGGDFSNSMSLTVAYDEVGIYPVTCLPRDVNDCVADSAAVAYVIVSGPTETEIMLSPSQAEYCEGDSLTISANAVYDNLLFVETDTFVFFYENDSLLFLPDGNGVSYEAAITVPSFIEDLNFPLQDIIVCLDIEHSYGGDLGIRLDCPSNQSINLISYPNNLGGTFLGEPVEIDEGIPYQYCFKSSDSSLIPFDEMVSQSESIPVGTYSPKDSLQQLLACDITGDWTLTITDNISFDNGVLFSWSIGLVVDNNLIVQNINYDSIVFMNSLQDINIEMPDGSVQNQSSVDVELALGDEFSVIFTDENGCDYKEILELNIRDTTMTSNPCYICTPLASNDTIFICLEETSVDYLGTVYDTEGTYIINGTPPYCNTTLELLVVKLDSFDYELEVLPADSTDANGQIILNTEGYTFLNDSIGSDLMAGIYNIDIYYGDCMESIMVEVPIYQELMADVTVSQNLVSNNTYTASVNIIGGLAPYVIEWSTGDIGTDISLDNLTTGNYWVSVTDAYMNVVTVDFEVGSVSATLPTAFESIDMFPNPTDENLNVKIELQEYSEIRISIFEMSGREVLNYHYSGMNLEKSLDISSLGSGVYFVGIQSDKDRVVRKITIL